MSKKFITSLAFIAALSIPQIAKADDPAPKHKWGGIDLGCGVPSGCTGQMLFRPFNWMKIGVGAGYNLMAPGVIGSLTLDPIPWPVGLTLTVDGGHYWSGNVPFVNNPPSVEYSFAEFLGGLEFGSRNVWRLYFRGGLTYLDGTASNFQTGNNTDSSTTVGNPRVHGWVAPAIRFGFSVYF